MNLHRMLAAREAEKRPVRVVLVGAGKFGSMYLSQARRTPGIHVVAVADLAPSAPVSPPVPEAAPAQAAEEPLPPPEFHLPGEDDCEQLARLLVLEPRQS